MGNYPCGLSAIASDSGNLPTLIQGAASILEPRRTSCGPNRRQTSGHCAGLSEMGPSALPRQRPLYSLNPSTAAAVQNDTSGNVRLVKRGFDSTGRDDVAAAARVGLLAHGIGPCRRTGIEEPRAAGHAVV